MLNKASQQIIEHIRTTTKRYEDACHRYTQEFMRCEINKGTPEERAAIVGRYKENDAVVSALGTLLKELPQLLMYVQEEAKGASGS